MLEILPSLQTDGWDSQCDPGFPYQLAHAEEWYADLATQAKERAKERAKDQWFDLQLRVNVAGRSINLLPALVSYLQGTLDSSADCYRVGDHLLLRMDDHRYLPIPMERIQRIADTLVELLERDSLNQHGALSLPLSHVHRLTHLLPASAVRSDNASLLTRIRDLESFAGIEPLPAPPDFRATLRSYQQEGLGWLQFLRRCQFGGVLADDMGLGKTVQTLAHLLLEKQQGRASKPSLIVAPVSVIGNWQQELRSFAPSLKVLTLHGAGRKALFHAINGADIVITGYPSLQLDHELQAHEFYFVILDEAQLIKNPRAKVSQAARQLRAQHRLCLTGTPMENHLGELWSLFDFLQPGLLGDANSFQRHYRWPIEKHGNRARAAALTRRIAPFVLRRTKDAVARELPPKTQIVESVVMDERQRDFYDGIRLAMHRHVREVIEQQGLARSQITVLDALLKLRQACCDPRLIDDSTPPIPSAKLDWLLTVLPELVAEGRRILLFSQFTSMLRLIEAAVAQLSIPYCLLTGETQQRAAVVQRFQSGAAPLFLISLKAGGTGLNLTAADTVIHYDPWWNPAVEAQATDRAHRIGQHQPVFVYKLIAQATVEEKIMQLQADKQALANQLYAGATTSLSQLSAADLQTLFAP
jgi:SNF2 family DNA or RNA helicase